ncbi:helix-turn-helix domain-containing protein [uncultured Ruminococcus sp.]|uniref:helix-turn-helix domain-containing protein n=1 Tax=uncultured Ruminococcus sp. TaxID=165186 RepID=UPI0025D8BBFC|nr:helix-turn-helix transcriptional regulator [uncultured Ruminococcus sp.]
MTFAEKIKHLRKARHLSQSELGEMIGITGKSIREYESGNSLPKSDKRYEKIAEIFDVPVDFLKNDTEDDFVLASRFAHGESGVVEAEKLVNQIAGLYAGGRLSDGDAANLILALQKAYWEIKEEKDKAASKKDYED